MKNLFTNLVLFFLLVGPVMAQPLDNNATSDTLNNFRTYAGGAGFSQDTLEPDMTLGTYMATIIKGFLSLMGIIFIILMIYAGFTWMTAGGDESKITKSKSTIARAAIGLFIVLGAYAITAIVFGVVDGGGDGYIPSTPMG